MKSQFYLVLFLLIFFSFSKCILNADFPEENKPALKIMEILKKKIEIHIDDKEKIREIDFLKIINQYNFFDEKLVTFIDSEEKNPFLYNTVNNLALKLKIIPSPLIFILKGRKDANAISVISYSKHAVIAINQTLLDILSEKEIEATIAHELGHILTKDFIFEGLCFSLGNGGLITSSIILGCILSKDKQAPIIKFLGGELLLSTLYLIIINLISAYKSRSDEKKADLVAAKIINYNDLISALQKITIYNQNFFNQNALTILLEKEIEEIEKRNPNFSKKIRCMFQDYSKQLGKKIEPLRNKINKFFEKLFSTHPEDEERLRYLEEAEKKKTEENQQQETSTSIS